MTWAVEDRVNFVRVLIPSNYFMFSLIAAQTLFSHTVLSQIVALALDNCKVLSRLVTLALVRHSMYAH